MRIIAQYKIFIGVILFLRLTSFSLFAKTESQTPYLTIENITGSTIELIKYFEAESGWVISYSSRLCFNDNIELPASTKPLEEFVEVIFGGCDVSIIIREKKLIVKPDNSRTNKITLSGIVVDASSAERLPYSTVFSFENEIGTISNGYGFFSIELPKGENRLSVGFVGYSQIFESLVLEKDTFIIIPLDANLYLDEVNIYSRRYLNKSVSKKLGVEELDADDIKKMPTVFGETDLVKSIQMLPGVQGGSEGFSGLYVRGGGPDQNLILMDDVPIYNIGHLFGFFSIFNGDAVKYVNIYKSGFPARFHGRLSSVVDIRMIDGNNEKIKGTVNIGLLASSVSINGPLIKNKLGFSASLRRTYMNPILSLYRAGGAATTYYFYDANLKLNYNISQRSRFYTSVYVGKDLYSTLFNSQKVLLEKDEGDDLMISVRDKTEASWGNVVGAARWNYIWNDKLFSNLTATTSIYNFGVGIENVDIVNFEESIFEQRYKSGVKDFTAKIDFDYYPVNSHYIKFGASYINHFFKPGIDIFTRDIDTKLQTDTIVGSERLWGSEASIYVEDEYSLSNKLHINVGVSSVLFWGETKKYNSVEPRFSAVYSLLDDLGVRISYTHMSQYIHTLNLSNIALPADLWLPVTDKIPPMKSRQASVGTFWTFGKINRYNFSVDMYYKSQKNLLHYTESAGFLDYSTRWDEKLAVGDGETSGIEFYMKKTTGKLQGWMSYTFSQASNWFDGINEGKPFPMRYDRPHDFRINSHYYFNEKLMLSSMWQYGSGLPITLPSEKYYAPDLHHLKSDIGYSEALHDYNSYRMLPFHRLDLSIIYSQTKKKYNTVWDFGVINVYGRKNPFMLYISNKSTPYGDKTLPERTIEQISLLSYPIPYIKYSIIF